MAQVRINRAPVLALWAAVVAERLGYDRDEALTLGKAVSGLNAQSKGQALGLYPGGGATSAGKARSEAAHASKAKPDSDRVELLHRAVPVAHTPKGLRALDKGKPSDPSAVERYLAGKFKDHLDAAREAMRVLARSMPPSRLAAEAYALYEQFRPRIPAGTKGWGQAGILDLAQIHALAHGRKRREPS